MRCFNHHSLHDRKIKLSGAISATRTILATDRTIKKKFVQFNCKWQNGMSTDKIDR
jgi:hypothetical protein